MAKNRETVRTLMRAVSEREMKLVGTSVRAAAAGVLGLSPELIPEIKFSRPSRRVPKGVTLVSKKGLFGDYCESITVNLSYLASVVRRRGEVLPLNSRERWDCRRMRMVGEALSFGSALIIGSQENFRPGYAFNPENIDVGAAIYGQAASYLGWEVEWMG